tara:strand:+ start:111 stop:230 length:120 start_codon:yes stop_codon:yes gene_type:complete
MAESIVKPGAALVWNVLFAEHVFLKEKKKLKQKNKFRIY